MRGAELPVLIHIADLRRFSIPGQKNERWEELKEFPRARGLLPNILRSRRRWRSATHLFAKHPKVNFIAAHLAFHGNDLGRLGKLFDTLPNMYVDIAAVSRSWPATVFGARFPGEVSRRVLMGKDIYEVNEYKWYFRALEHATNISSITPPPRVWRIYGFQVPDEVLKRSTTERVEAGPA